MSSFLRIQRPRWPDASPPSPSSTRTSLTTPLPTPQSTRHSPLLYFQVPQDHFRLRLHHWGRRQEDPQGRPRGSYVCVSPRPSSVVLWPRPVWRRSPTTWEPPTSSSSPTSSRTPRPPTMTSSSPPTSSRTPASLLRASFLPARYDSFFPSTL